MKNNKNKESYVDKKFGKVCPKCKKRHITISTHGHNLPKSDINECDGK